MTPTDQALLEEIEKRAERDRDNKHITSHDEWCTKDRSTLLRLLKEAMAQQRTPHTVEVCEMCDCTVFDGSLEKSKCRYDNCPLRTGAPDNG